MTTSTPASSELRVALDEIRLRTNVREVVENDVDAPEQRSRCAAYSCP